MLFIYLKKRSKTIFQTMHSYTNTLFAYTKVIFEELYHLKQVSQEYTGLIALTIQFSSDSWHSCLCT